MAGERADTPLPGSRPGAPGRARPGTPGRALPACLKIRPSGPSLGGKGPSQGPGPLSPGRWRAGEAGQEKGSSENARSTLAPGWKETSPQS